MIAAKSRKRGLLLKTDKGLEKLIGGGDRFSVCLISSLDDDKLRKRT